MPYTQYHLKNVNELLPDLENTHEEPKPKPKRNPRIFANEESELKQLINQFQDLIEIQERYLKSYNEANYKASGLLRLIRKKLKLTSYQVSQEQEISRSYLNNIEVARHTFNLDRQNQLLEYFKSKLYNVPE